VESSALTADHWVSRGLQANFANVEKRVAVLDVASGRIVASDRPVRSNFREIGFTTFLRDGVRDDVLERVFNYVEQSVLNQIRRVDVSNCGPKLKAAVANLFSIHLVRSPSYKAFHADIVRTFAGSRVGEVAASSELSQRFERHTGRAPVEGELQDLAASQFEAISQDPLTLVRSMTHHHDVMAEKLNRFHMQVIEIDPMLPGLVLGDTPIVHASSASGRYGFRDRLALDEADLVVGPLTRRVAACFTVEPLPPVVVRTKELVDQINAVFIRAASAEVACHPDDALATRQLHGRLDRLPSPFGVR
jgi:hypothetical protein